MGSRRNVTRRFDENIGPESTSWIIIRIASPSSDVCRRGASKSSSAGGWNGATNVVNWFPVAVLASACLSRIALMSGLKLERKQKKKIKNKFRENFRLKYHGLLWHVQCLTAKKQRQTLTAVIRDVAFVGLLQRKVSRHFSLDSVNFLYSQRSSFLLPWQLTEHETTNVVKHCHRQRFQHLHRRPLPRRPLVQVQMEQKHHMPKPYSKNWDEIIFVFPSNNSVQGANESLQLIVYLRGIFGNSRPMSRWLTSSELEALMSSS